MLHTGKACLCRTDSSRGQQSLALCVRSVVHYTLLFALFCSPQDVGPHACSDHTLGTDVDDLG